MASKLVSIPFSDANRSYVSSLYRRSIRLSRSWINRYDLYRDKTIEIRAMFDANKNVNDPNELQTILKKTEALLTEYKHPDPIIPPQRPGGTKFERNIPPSLETPIPENY